MKTSLLAISLLFGCYTFGQNQLYIVTEKYDGVIRDTPTFDSVFVTDPNGITTTYSIPSLIINPAA